MKVWMETVCLIALAGIGLYLLADGTGRYRTGRASEDWPATPVVVLEARTERSATRHSTSYEPIVRYRYTVNGTQYESEQLYAYTNSGARRVAEQVLAQYPVGSEHTGYYNPDNPQQAVLVRGTHWKNFARMGGGVIAILIGVVGVRQSWRGKDQPERAATLPLEE